MTHDNPSHMTPGNPFPIFHPFIFWVPNVGVRVAVRLFQLISMYFMVFQCVSVCCYVGAIWGIMGPWVDGICLVVVPPRRLAAAPPSPASPTAEWPPPWRTAAASAGAISPSWQQGRPTTSAGATGRPRAVCCWAGAACGLDGHDGLNQF